MVSGKLNPSVSADSAIVSESIEETQTNLLDGIHSPSDLKDLSIKELTLLAGEIREFLIENVIRCGGHLSSNLGVVELTIALHYVFDCPADDIIWDVGHQAYVHKILTGRKEQFRKLRQRGGLSGFPNPKESEYDVIHTGHSSTSLSIASGIAQSKRLNRLNTRTIAVIGDGAFTSGMVYEAMNTIAHHNLPVITVLNDNGMSISKNVGGISRYLNKLRTVEPYVRFKRKVESFLDRLPLIGKPIKMFLYNLKESVKEVIVPGSLFHEMGMIYYGTFDGHNIADLIHVFTHIKHTVDRPVILHILTQKGKGYQPSEDNPTLYHGVPRVETEEAEVGKKKSGFSSITGKTVERIAETDEKVVAVVAAMKEGTGFSGFAAKFPDRFTDVGIAEAHCVDYALGLAIKGFKPVVALYSTFLQRAYDQLLNDVGIANAGILFCIDRAGLVSDDGETHQGIFDISYLRMIPNFTMLMPANDEELEMMIEETLKNLKGPVAIRYPKDDAHDVKEYRCRDHPLREGEGVVVKEGRDAILVSTGMFLHEALKAEKIAENEKLSLEIYNLRYAKPINNYVIEYLSKDSRAVIIVEDGIYNGGIGEYLQSRISNCNPEKKIEVVCVPDVYPELDRRKSLLKEYKMTAEAVVEKVLKLKNG